MAGGPAAEGPLSTYGYGLFTSNPNKTLHSILPNTRCDSRATEPFTRDFRTLKRVETRRIRLHSRYGRPTAHKPTSQHDTVI